MAMNIFKAWTGPCAFGFQTKNLDDHTISSLRSSRADAWILVHWTDVSSTNSMALASMSRQNTALLEISTPY